MTEALIGGHVRGMMIKEGHMLGNKNRVNSCCKTNIKCRKYDEIVSKGKIKDKKTSNDMRVLYFTT